MKRSKLLFKDEALVGCLKSGSQNTSRILRCQFLGTFNMALPFQDFSDFRRIDGRFNEEHYRKKQHRKSEFRVHFPLSASFRVRLNGVFRMKTDQ